jgi:outer membrane receptor protein involved in Fe transport
MLCKVDNGQMSFLNLTSNSFYYSNGLIRGNFEILFNRGSVVDKTGIMKFLLLIFLSVFVILNLQAQIDREPPQSGNDMGLLRIKESKLYGKVVDSRSNKGIEAASIQLFVFAKDSLIGGMLTKANGDFSIEKIKATGSLRIIITAMGYENSEITISLNEEEVKQGFQKDLGNIILKPAVKELGAVTVTAQRPGLVLGIDRKIFNVEKSLVASGGTGLDVMRSIPSVSVDVDGNVTLRKSSPQIFVDGRPTILTLDQIPADNIERVELITNPSAKFDAASDGGIINVILKKNKRIGMNGVFSVGAGSPDILNSSLNLNIREGKFNYFAIGSFNQSGGRARGETLRQNKENGIIEDYFNQYSYGQRMRRFGSVRFGVDYFLDNRNTISITQNFVKGKNSNEEEQEQEYLNVNQQLQYYGQRFSDSRSTFNRNNTQLNYTHKFPEQGKELTATVNYNAGDGKENSGIRNLYFKPDGTEYNPPAEVRNDGVNDNKQWTFQVDYVNPKGEDAKFETGIRTFINNYSSRFDAFAVSSNGTEQKLSISNNYKYRELINAAYATYTNKWKSWGYQLGLRAEHSKFDGELVDSARKFGYEYPTKLRRIWDALFPSLFLTREFGEDVEVQLNYSRRIRRPNFWQLNPFVDITDPVNLRQGNPQLRPEFVNSFEFNYSHSYGRGNNFLGVIYFRNNPGDVTRYSDTISAAQYQQLNNAAIDPNAILNTFINGRVSNWVGLEVTLQQEFGEHFDITPSMDVQYRRVNAKVNDLDLSNDGFSWEASVLFNYKTITTRPSLFRNFSIQAEWDYESPEVQAQGRSRAEYQFDLAFRKDFGKDKKANLTFSISDLFNTLKFGNVYDTDNFYQDSYGRRNVRSFRLVFTYKFGKADFSFRRNRDGGGDEGE